MEYIVEIKENERSEFMELIILPVQKVTGCNLMITHGYVSTCVEYAQRWQYPNQCGLVLVLGEHTPREKICYILESKLENGVKVYVNGSHKVQWIEEKLKKKMEIVDLESIGCPSIEELQHDLRIANTSDLRHSGDCAPRNAYLYRNWLLSQKNRARANVGESSKRWCNLQ